MQIVCKYLKAMILTSIYFDSRRIKNDGTYPVKLRITFNRRQRYYNTGISMTEEKFKHVTEDIKPREEYKKIKLELAAIENKAKAVIDKLPFFSFDAFERQFLLADGDKTNIFDWFEKTILQLQSEDRVGTKKSYECAKNSLEKYFGSPRMTFFDVTVNSLKDYEQWMLKSENSITTVGIYLRNLRAIFNAAIMDGTIPKEVYPFGKHRYTIPAKSNVKKALNRIHVQQISNYKPVPGSQEHWARDMWLFSYLCNGANMNDIALLKYKDMEDDKIVFLRGKTIRTSRQNLKPIVVYLIPYAKRIIKTWGNKPPRPEHYIFPILQDGYTPEQFKAAVLQAIKQINKYFNRVLKEIGITTRVTTIAARHTFSTIMMQNGASDQFIKDSVGHANIKTTENYLSSFDEDIKREFAGKLLEFEEK
jgi:integrase/recombinase XerD